MKFWLSAAVVVLVAHSAAADFRDWKHAGSVHVLTTPEGAD